MNQILSQNILDNNGYFNHCVFNEEIHKEDKIENDKNKKPKFQYIKIFYDSPYPKKIIKIKNIDDFKLKNNFKFNYNDNSVLSDLEQLYRVRNYKNIDKFLFDGFTNDIKDIIKEIYDLSTKDITDKFNDFLSEITQKIIEIIEYYLNLDMGKLQKLSDLLKDDKKKIFLQIIKIFKSEIFDKLFKNEKY